MFRIQISTSTGTGTNFFIGLVKGAKIELNLKFFRMNTNIHDYQTSRKALKAVTQKHRQKSLPRRRASPAHGPTAVKLLSSGARCGCIFATCTRPGRWCASSAVGSTRTWATWRPIGEPSTRGGTRPVPGHTAPGFSPGRYRYLPTVSHTLKC